MNIGKIFWNRGEYKKNISHREYFDNLIRGRTLTEIKYTYEKAWESKQFEIANYWKRANYFWLFQVAAFTAYFTVLGSGICNKNSEVLYAVIAIGLITGFAWILTNQGSKQWQENWEMHVNKLEDYVTGPLYKIGTNHWTYSVSKLNFLVSIFISIIWVILAIKFLIENSTIVPSNSLKPQWFVIVITVIIILFMLSMLFGYGRSANKFENKDFYWYYEDAKNFIRKENKENEMDNEKTLHEKNETLRIVGMYSFLFYVVICGVFVFTMKEKTSNCVAFILLVIGLFFAIGLGVFAKFVIFRKENDKTKADPKE